MSWRRRLDDSRAGLISTTEAAHLEHPNKSFRCYRYNGATSIQASFDTPESAGEEHLNVHETLRWQPRFPDFQRGFAAAVCPGGHG
jgi:hypothetical protein